MDTKYQSKFTRVVIQGFICMMLLCLTTASPAQEAAAKVQFMVGDVSATSADGKSRNLVKGDRIYPGDTIKTGDTGAAQLIYRDRSRMAVRVNTEFTIKEYRFDKKKTSGAKSIFSLLSGALRSITGLIGSRNPESVTIQTSVATIGIRGTDHEVVHISPEFQKRNPLAEVGTYNKVYTGGTIMKTDRGNINLGLHQVGFVGGTRGNVLKPIRIKDMPKSITDQLINKIPVQAKIKPKKQPVTKSRSSTSTSASRSKKSSRKATATRSIGATTTLKKLDSTMTKSLDSAVQLDSKSSLPTLDRSIDSGTTLEKSAITTIQSTDTLKSAIDIAPALTYEPKVSTTISPTLTPSITTTISPTQTLTPSITTTISPTQTLQKAISPTTTEALKSIITVAPTRISK